MAFRSFISTSTEWLPRLLLQVVATAFFVTLPMAQTAETQTVENIQFGIMSEEGVTRTLEDWSPMVAVLNENAAAQGVPYRFSMTPIADTAFLQHLSDGRIDIFVGDPASFVAAEVEEGARAILSMAHMWEGRSYDQTGALIFTRADSAIRSIEDLRGKSLMAVDENELTGWKVAKQEFRKYRMEPSSALSDLMFSGGNQREVVYAVQEGLVDAGVVRAGLLERLAVAGVVDLAEFRAVAPMSHVDFPFMVSTPLYPDWALAAMPNVPDEALALVINAYLDLDVTSPEVQATGGKVWQAPQNYQAVHELLISLRARPYENYLRQAAARIFNAYRWPFIGLGAVLLFSLVFLVFELRRNAKLAEARKDVLKSEVRSKQFYRNAVEDHTVFCMLTQDGNISHVNQRMLDTLGRDRTGLVKRPLTEILRDTEHEQLEQEIMKSMNSCVPWQGALQLTKGDGSAAWVQCTFIPVTSASDKLSEIAIVASDVTETRSGVSEERFNNALELSEDQVVVLRPETLDILYANVAASNTLFWNRFGKDWKGKTAKDFITEEDYDSLKLCCEAVIEGPQRRVTWEAEAKNDVTFEISLEYVQPEDDEPRLIAIYRDISERKLIEKAKTEFIATISHELRTPLTSMKGAFGLVTSGMVGDVPEKMKGLVGIASTNCDRLITLINDILDLEKIEAGKMTFTMSNFDLNELVETALESNQYYADTLGVTVAREEKPGGTNYMTFGDRMRLTQVMDNLMSNAAKFSEKGEVVHVGLEEMDDRLRISIRDTGSGIPEAAQAQIFDKFTQADSSDTRAKGGTGLGLSIVKLIVESHQGDVHFNSVEGEGTEFFVDLPKVEGEEVIPIPRTANGDVLPSANAIQMVPEVVSAASTIPKTAIERLVARLGDTADDVKVEQNHITAQQVANGKGVMGNSTVLNWINMQDRGLLSQLLENGDMENCEIAIVEFSNPNGPKGAFVTASDTLGAWIADCDDLIVRKSAEKISVLSVTDDYELAEILKKQNKPAVANHVFSKDTGMAKKGDAIAKYGLTNDASVTLLAPIKGRGFPESWPLTVFVQRHEAAKSAAGVVSKFSSGGGRSARRAS